ncbi:MAG: hypothetical protein HY922_01390 [Elusimicrobia bacterium]|nr:hypothetical protein [Elusimicrobiota bacterium]
MENERDSKLHRALKALPDRRAPKTLLPRVMKAAAARAEDSRQRSAWWTWRAPARWAYMLAVAGAGALSLKAGFEFCAAGLRILSVVQTLAGGVWTILGAFWSMGGPVLQGLALLMAAACAAFGAGLARLAIGPAYEETKQ